MHVSLQETAKLESMPGEFGRRHQPNAENRLSMRAS